MLDSLALTPSLSPYKSNNNAKKETNPFVKQCRMQVFGHAPLMHFMYFKNHSHQLLEHFRQFVEFYKTTRPQINGPNLHINTHSEGVTYVYQLRRKEDQPCIQPFLHDFIYLRACQLCKHPNTGISSVHPLLRNIPLR